MKISVRTIKMMLLIFLLSPLFGSSYVSPLISNTISYTLYTLRSTAGLALFLISAAIYICKRGYITKDSKSIIAFHFIYTLISVVYVVLNISSIQYSTLRELTMWFTANLFCCLFFSTTESKERQNLAILFLLMCTFIIANFSIAGASLSFKRSAGLAGAPYTTMIVLYMGICLIWLLNEKSIILKAFLILSIFLSFYTVVFVLQRASNTIFGIILCVLILFFNRKRGNYSTILLFFGIIVVIIAFYTGGLRYLMLELSNIVGTTRFSDRIHSVILYSSTGEWSAGGESAVDRFDLVLRSFRTWTESLRSFIIGVGDHRNNNFIIGNHGVLVDSLARYGIIGSIFLFGGIRRQITQIIKKIDNNVLRIQVYCIFGYCIIRGIIGNILEAGISLQLFFFLPLVIENCQEQNT